MPSAKTHSFSPLPHLSSDDVRVERKGGATICWRMFVADAKSESSQVLFLFYRHVDRRGRNNTETVKYRSPSVIGSIFGSALGEATSEN
jgi:hypothetical protein